MALERAGIVAAPDMRYPPISPPSPRTSNSPGRRMLEMPQKKPQERQRQCRHSIASIDPSIFSEELQTIDSLARQLFRSPFSEVKPRAAASAKRYCCCRRGALSGCPRAPLAPGTSASPTGQRVALLLIAATRALRRRADGHPLRKWAGRPRSVNVYCWRPWLVPGRWATPFSTRSWAITGHLPASLPFHHTFSRSTPSRPRRAIALEMVKPPSRSAPRE